jgi:hypothetical protein
MYISSIGINRLWAPARLHAIGEIFLWGVRVRRTNNHSLTSCTPSREKSATQKFADRIVRFSSHRPSSKLSCFPA